MLGISIQFTGYTSITITNKKKGIKGLPSLLVTGVPTGRGLLWLKLPQPLLPPLSSLWEHVSMIIK
jgi:hypothetical protein